MAVWDVYSAQVECEDGIASRGGLPPTPDPPLAAAFGDTDGRLRAVVRTSQSRPNLPGGGNNFSTNFTNYQKMSKKSIWALKNQKFQSSCPKRVKNVRKKSDSTIFNFWANRVTHKVGQILRPANSAAFVGHTICPKIKSRRI